MSGKWPFEPHEAQAVQEHFQGRYAVRDRCLHILGLISGFRVSELLSMTVGQVRQDSGHAVDFITVKSANLKGGKSRQTTAKPTPKPDGHVDGCLCKGCKPKPRTRRSPDPRTVEVPEEAKAFIQALLDELQARHGPLAAEWPLFMSRKHAKGGTFKAISRQQAHHVLKQSLKRAGIDGNFATHSWRKTAANGVYVGTGKDIMATRDFLGHRDIATTQRYLRSCDANIRGAVRAVAATFIKMVA